MKKLVYNLILPLCFVAILLWSVIGVSQFRPFFSWQYQKLNRAEAIGIGHEDLMAVTDGLLSYMLGTGENLDMQYTVRGEMREIFDQREKLHMIDVKNLYLGVVKTGAVLSALVAVMLWYLAKADGLKTAKATLKRKYRFAAIGLLAVAAVFGGVIVTNFQWFWYNFHLVFFTNDLWLLDPKVSIMINMFPLEFFYAICAVILVVFVLLCGGVYLCLGRKERVK